VIGWLSTTISEIGVIRTLKDSLFSKESRTQRQNRSYFSEKVQFEKISLLNRPISKS
jgi:hypothetical protein